MGSVVTLLVTDIVGSTRLWLDHEATMRSDLARHDDLAATITAAHGGTIFKHTGDGMMAAFDDPADGARAAADLQRAIAAAGWASPGGLAIRAAVHSGTVHDRDGDLFGSSVSRAARLLDLCPPGAVLVSTTTAGLLADRSLDGIRLREVGVAHLRGFRDPERVHALVGDHLAAVGEIVNAEVDESAARGNLPHVADDLVGRNIELAAVWDALRNHRVVSLVGVGGMGKTRLALEAAAGIQRSYPDGVWWCDLVAATSADAVAPVVLDAINARSSGGQGPVEAIAEHLRDTTSLMVLDNCEHVLDASRDIAEALRSSCPRVTVLCTSREALGISGEALVSVTSLDEPSAVDLFVQRATSVRPDLELTDEARAVVGEICAQLDGIPLALELAASRCRSMSPAEIADRLHDRFRLLRGGRATSERHRTLQAAIAWSYSMLDDDERDVFDTMSVFAGGSLLDGLAAVAELDEYDALDLVDRLVARSLVVPTDTPLGTRYRQLETLRQFAEDRLNEQGRSAEVRARHLDWVRGLVRAGRDAWGTPAAAAGFVRYVAEIDNVRVAVAHAVASGRHDDAYALVADSYYGIVLRPTPEAAGWVDPFDQAGAWTVARAEAAAVVSAAAYLAGDGDALDRGVSAIPEQCREASPIVRYWVALNLVMTHGDTSAAAAALVPRPSDETRDLHRAGVAMLMVHNLRALQGVDGETTHAMHEEGDRLVADVLAGGDKLDAGVAMAMHSLLLANTGQTQPALELARQVEQIAHELGAMSLLDLAWNTTALCWGRMVEDESSDRAALRASVAAALHEARERRSLLWAMAIFAGASLLLVDDDPISAYLLELSRLRVHPGFEVLPDPPVALDAQQMDRLRSRAATLSLADMVEVAITALEADHDSGAGRRGQAVPPR